MTKTEAKQAMKSGSKVTHTGFTDDEWITTKDGKVLTEEGYRFYPDAFWSWRTDSYFDDGWSIYKD